ncbi:hypothetical protein HK101_004695 [Irineochytrium annulatum]|nr:hypothetical protein HK101_004695 [Irineochytrium annulatum]
MSKSQCVEGVRILESLVNYVSEANPEDLEMLSEPITAIRRAKWFERLCSGYSITRSFPKERDAGIVALNYLGAESWPHGDEEIKLALKKMQRRLCINWVLNFGGRLKSKPSSKRTSPDNSPSKAQAIAEIIELEKAVLFSMAEALGFDKTFTSYERLYLVMRHCNLLIRYNYNAEDWTCTLYKVAYYGIFAMPKISPFFMRAADISDKGGDRPSHVFVKASE